MNLMARLLACATAREPKTVTLPCPTELAAAVTDLQQIDGRLSGLQQLLAEVCVSQLLASHDLQSLNRSEAQVCSQSGEDGIIAEIFRRIGTTNRCFVEVGVGTGVSNNTVWLLLQGWRGGWLERDIESVRSIEVQFEAPLASGQLRLRQCHVTANNIETSLQSLDVPHEFDFLSIDIDGNDYWVWEAVRSYRPRVVVIEYNARFPPPFVWVKPYEARGEWDGTSHFGASLQALEQLGAHKGYRLVGCTLSGINAFFVRDDLCCDVNGNERFATSPAAANVYQPPRYFLVQPKGFPFRFAPFDAPEISENTH